VGPNTLTKIKMELKLFTVVLILVCVMNNFYISKAQDDEEEEIMERIIDDYEHDGDASVEESDSEPEIVVPVEKPEYRMPVPKGNVYLVETFESSSDLSGWTLSTAKKDGTDDSIAKYDGEWVVEEPSSNPLKNDLHLGLKSKAKHHAISTALKKQFNFQDKPFIAHYEVKFEEGQECGGAYIKLLHDSSDLKNFKDSTPYVIMFGPDKCGNDNKLHFIFKHKNPLTGALEEKHAKKPTAAVDKVFTDKNTHSFTLILNPDNTFKVMVDGDIVNSGSLLEDMEPSVNPPKEIVDPDDKKPADWDEREKINDPDAVKPEDWDETEPEDIKDESAVKPVGWLDDELENIPDPDAEKPNDWDEDMDGEWEAPLVSNPACEAAPGCGEWSAPMMKNPKFKGKWKSPLIDNPNFKGKWKPRIIPNKDYFEDLEPFKMSSIDAVGLELWSMSANIYFDNFLITDDVSVLNSWVADTYTIKHAQELRISGASSVVDAILDATRERPWLWAVFILVVVLPIVLIIAFCCCGGSSSQDDAEKKKSDEPTEDDEVEEEENTNTSEISKSPEAENINNDEVKETKKKSKSELEEEASEADVEEDDQSNDVTVRKRKSKVPKDN